MRGRLVPTGVGPLKRGRDKECRSRTKYEQGPVNELKPYSTYRSGPFVKIKDDACFFIIIMIPRFLTGVYSKSP